MLLKKILQTTTLAKYGVEATTISKGVKIFCLSFLKIYLHVVCLVYIIYLSRNNVTTSTQKKKIIVVERITVYEKIINCLLCYIDCLFQEKKFKLDIELHNDMYIFFSLSKHEKNTKLLLLKKECRKEIVKKSGKREKKLEKILIIIIEEKNKKKRKKY
ncbi:hypothetical protein RFI_08568 [Reticulomyxa filosa]|uniref:Uncharacterized protein n=1 Tax=Reticulomyxa filosa TaxID=46433 RepID=X6NRB6_RETFI|nr:hypothetical protein RFI_08568 [Reticulomyxa filosa]|eukprot:ETO28561.1 hypothetical protein RFI_08568 [Reticulomyxa filosa]